jgi:hypothetical protein
MVIHQIANQKPDKSHNSNEKNKKEQSLFKNTIVLLKS